MENKQQRQASESCNLIGDHTLILASQSPRRAEILGQVGWRFVVRVADVDESRHEREAAEDYVQRLAEAKAASVTKQTTRGCVLGADTVVVIDDRVLGKPRDEADARLMLESLSGRWHEVLTGVALLKVEDGKVVARRIAYERTRVLFGAMTDDDIALYIQSGEPADKAGGYAVQGRAAKFIERIEGDYWNVVGLPVRLVYKLARQLA